MGFDVDADEQALQDGIRAWCTGRVPMTRVRATIDTGGVDRELFGELADQGVLGLTTSEGDGGMGLGATHATVVFEELGRGLVPGPVVATHLAAGLVDGALGGTTIVTEVEHDGRLVLHPRAVDGVVVVSDAGLALHDVTDTGSVEPFDPVTGVATTEAIGERRAVLGDAATAADWRRRRTLLVSAQLLGAAAGATDLAVTYAGQREQFGRAIGSFQAIKHLCADALTRVEVARAAVYAAACHLDGRVPPDATAEDLDRALAAAALLARDAAMRNAKTSIQVHGGMGFTWEVDAHLYLKRATVWGSVVGDEAGHALRLAEAM